MLLKFEQMQMKRPGVGAERDISHLKIGGLL